MTTETIEIMSKAEIKERITKENTRFDVALRSHMEKCERISKGLKAEMDAYKDIGKQVFGENGGNTVFRTKTVISFLMNMEELIELIGEDKVKELKNKIRKTTTLEW